MPVKLAPPDSEPGVISILMKSENPPLCLFVVDSVALILMLSRRTLERWGINRNLNCTRQDSVCNRIEHPQVQMRRGGNAIAAMSGELKGAVLLRLTPGTPISGVLIFEALASGCGLPYVVRKRIFGSFSAIDQSGMSQGLPLRKGISKNQAGAENRPEGDSGIFS